MRRAGHVLLTVLLVAACAPAGPTLTDRPSGGAPATSDAPAGLGLRYVCGEVPFDPAVLAGPVGAEHDTGPAAAALREHLASGGPEVDGLPNLGWIHVGGTPVLADYVARNAAGEMVFVTVQQDAGAWLASGWGGCRPTAVVEGMSLATWAFPPGAPPPDPASTSFTALVTERACTGGTEMGARLQPPRIAYGDTTVTVLFAAVPLPGGHDCPGNPSAEVEVELQEPLGDRRLVDGAYFPPADPAAEPQ